MAIIKEHQTNYTDIVNTISCLTDRNRHFDGQERHWQAKKCLKLFTKWGVKKDEHLDRQLLTKNDNFPTTHKIEIETLYTTRLNHWTNNRQIWQIKFCIVC